MESLSPWLLMIMGLEAKLKLASVNEDAKRSSSVTKTRGTIFNQNDKVVLIALRRRDVYIIDMSFFQQGKKCMFSCQSLSKDEYSEVHLGIFASRKEVDAADCIRDHLGRFNEKADDGFFLGYSLVAKAFRMFNIRRQEMEETVHVTFSEDDEVISQTSTEEDVINFNENRSFSDDEFIEPRTKDTQCSANIEYFPYVSAYENTTLAILPTLQNSITSEEPSKFTIAGDLAAIHELDHAESTNILESAEPQDNVLSESISDDQLASVISPSTEVILQNPAPQDRWSRDKHIELVNIIGEPLAGITTRSRIRDSNVASAHECLYVNFLSEIKPMKLIEALEEEVWVIAMQEELN
ncbi:hypothetical protein Tco_0505181 [Tanacetum coccineum]